MHTDYWLTDLAWLACLFVSDWREALRYTAVVFTFFPPSYSLSLSRDDEWWMILLITICEQSSKQLITNHTLTHFQLFGILRHEWRKHFLFHCQRRSKQFRRSKLNAHEWRRFLINQIIDISARTVVVGMLLVIVWSLARLLFQLLCVLCCADPTTPSLAKTHFTL